MSRSSASRITDFGSGVDRRGGFVEDEDRRRLHERASDADPLAFAAGEARAAFAELGVVARGQALDELVRIGGLRRFDDFLFGRVEVAVANVVGDGATYEQRLLEHQPDVSPQRMLAHGADVATVDRDPARRRVVEPHQEIDERRLARAGRSDDRDDLSGLDREADVLQGSVPTRIVEVEAFHCDRAPHVLEVVRVRLILHVGNDLHDLARESQCDEVVLELAHRRADRLERLVDRPDVRDHDEQLPECRASCRARSGHRRRGSGPSRWP